MTVNIRAAELGDAELFYRARFNEAANHVSKSKIIPPYRDHLKWYRENHHMNFYTVLLDDTPIGYVRLDKHNEISMALLPDYCGKRYGQHVLKILVAQFKGLRAEIYASNIPSVKLFSRFPEIEIKIIQGAH